MTSIRDSFMGPHSHGSRPRDRLRAFLADQYSGAHAAKCLARDLRCTPKAAENMLGGHWPGDLHLGAIVRRFGRDVWDVVFEPEIEPVLARLKEEERRIDRQLHAARARRRQVEGVPFSLADRHQATAAEKDTLS